MRMTRSNARGRGQGLASSEVAPVKSNRHCKGDSELCLLHLIGCCLGMKRRVCCFRYCRSCR
jgi:hypothetical protein